MLSLICHEVDARRFSRQICGMQHYASPGNAAVISRRMPLCFERFCADIAVAIFAFLMPPLLIFRFLLLSMSRLSIISLSPRKELLFAADLMSPFHRAPLPAHAPTFIRLIFRHDSFCCQRCMVSPCLLLFSLRCCYADGMI